MAPTMGASDSKASSPTQEAESNAVASKNHHARILHIDIVKMTRNKSSIRSVIPSGAWGLGLLSQPATPVIAAPTVQVFDINITESLVLAAQDGWCKALLQISSDYASGGITKAKATAAKVIDQAYAFEFGPVAFKPTLTTGKHTFRTTRAGALANFVGNDPSFPLDTGFALTPWRTCKVVNQVIQLSGALAITMGNVVFSDASGELTSVDKTWGFMKEPDGSVRIILHHSSLPFKP
ncbi:phosphoribosyl-AMP cyclohydrolase [Synechococcus sp. BA-124 BA4]|uniref:phosphoribosyl-AMP cyclohydrolase n=1 Tax=Synechococcus sp. BA-124 BA4 TaxID=3110251 RepID=UPI002B1FA50F|nr:phosphoribosyl-AMP cyclohydrolase [Synechococcus sp. BA-124 BA4]MEA5399666.1 phosphoribosyl-AMP cyclohydrolase [Synechococcus sp. BA-124 BA4]